MSLGHFSYLLSEPNTRHTKVASDRLELLAKTSAKRYIEERAPLNGTIQKIAVENDLNSNQIERICEMANIATHQGLWVKTANKESVAFPLADARAIVSALGKPPMESSEGGGSSVCPAMSDSDYAGPPKSIPMAGPSTMSMFGADPSETHHGLHEEPEKKQIVIILQKKAEERKDVSNKVLYMGMELESLQKQAYNAVKQAVIGGATIRQIYVAASSSGLGKVAQEYLSGWEQRLIAETHGTTRLRLEKFAISKAPEDLISEDMGNVSVANGAHPVLISLDTVQRKTGEIKNGLTNILRIDDEVKMYNQRLRELT